MKVYKSLHKQVVNFCCLEMFHQVCIELNPDYRIMKDIGDRYLPYNGKFLKYCPFCGAKNSSIFKLVTGEIVKR